MSNKITIVIPAFNEASTIARVIAGVKAYSNEVIVVNDASSDATESEAKKAGALVVTHEKNKGYDGSLQDGFEAAVKNGADIIVTFDADGQHQPEDIKKMTDIIISGKASIVVGQRPYLTHFAEKIFAIYTNLFFGVKDPLCGLKAYRREVYEKVGHFDTLNSIGTQLMIEGCKKGFKLEKITINLKEREDVSRFYFKKIKANLKIFKALLKVIFLSV